MQSLNKREESNQQDKNQNNNITINLKKCKKVKRWLQLPEKRINPKEKGDKIKINYDHIYDIN